ncbi:MAG: hypothetical protein MUE68_00380 [Bacteroidetes bacterium]|jgi:hypothetical protein|nr:hypothetical protein [Bacteroidota bacterium]
MKNRFQALRIIVTALTAGQLAFLAVVFALQRSVAPPESFDPTILPIVATIVLLSSATASIMLGRMLRDKAATFPDEASRWSAYQTSVIIRLALPEGASFLVIVFYLLTGEWLFLLFFIASFGAFLFQKPSEDEWERVRSGSA